MKKVFCLAVSLALVFACFGFVGVKSELESNEEEIPKLTEADLNYVWLESKGSQTLGYNTLKVVNAYVGQTLTETLVIRNKTKETLNYSLTTELMDCENKVVWQDGDRLAMKLSIDKISLKAGEKKKVPVKIQVLKNHSGNAYFRIFITPSKGKKEFVSLNICQFDTKAEIMTTKPPVMFKTLSEALKNRTKLGRLIRKPDKTFLIYGNIHLFCFDTKSGKFTWHYNNKVSIIDIMSYEGCLITQNMSIIREKDGLVTTNQIITNPNSDLKTIELVNNGFHSMGIIFYSFRYTKNKDNVWDEYKIFFKNIHTSSVYNKIAGRADSFFVLPNNYGIAYIRYLGFEMGESDIGVFDIASGKKLAIIGIFNWIRYKSKYQMIVTGFPSGNIDVFDTLNLRHVLKIDNKWVARFDDTENHLFFADYKQVSCFDYSSKKILWRLLGNGDPIADPLYDEKTNSLYVLDEDSIRDKDGYISKTPTYMRLFRFDAKTGKQLWKAILFKYNDNVSSFFDSFSNKCQISTGNGKVTINANGVLTMEFNIRASDGKPWK